MNASLDKRVGMRARYGLAGDSAGPRAERCARSVARGFGMPKSIHRGSRMLALRSGRKGAQGRGFSGFGTSLRLRGERRSRWNGHRCRASERHAILGGPVDGKGRVGRHDAPIGAASSAGRALRSQCRGRGFDPPAVHQTKRSRLNNLQQQGLRTLPAPFVLGCALGVRVRG